MHPNEACAARTLPEECHHLTQCAKRGFTGAKPAVQTQALARQNLAVVGQSYELGRVTVFDVLAEQRRYLEVERAYTDALRAVALDDSLAEAHASLGVMRMRSFDFASAENHLRRAIELDPNPFEITFALVSYVALGWADEALETAARYNASSNGIDISRLVQARLDRDFDVLSFRSNPTPATAQTPTHTTGSPCSMCKG